LIWNEEPEDVQLTRRNAQIRLEQEMLEYGRQKYWKDYGRAPDEGIPEQCLIDSSIVELEEKYQEWIDRICDSPKVPNWVYPLLELGSRKMADITIRAVIRHWFSPSYWNGSYNEHIHTPPIAQKIACQIANDSCDIIAFQRAKEAHYEDWKKQSKFIKNWTIKRCTAFAKRMECNVKLSTAAKHSFGHHMLEIACSSNILTLRKEKTKTRSGRFRTYSFVEFHPEILKELHRRHDILQNSTLVYRPMLIPPIDHTLSTSGGYITTNLRKPVVQRYNDNFFGDLPKQQKFSEPSELVLRGLNGLMNTEWSVNAEVYEIMKTLFENNTRLANLPPYSFDEFLYSEPYPKDGTKEEQAKWMQYREESWGDWYKSEQARGRMLVRLSLAETMIPWDYFYHVWTLDFRGRAYTTCELLSPQSSDFDKGLIKFAKRIKLTTTGIFWRKVHIANLFDQDKKTFVERAQWVDEHHDMLIRIAEDPYENKEWIDDKKKKNKSFQRIAAIFDYAKMDGCSDIPIQIDGKCNGNQHWSSIMRDETIAKLTGVDPSDKPEDLYQFVADGTTQYCKTHRNENEWNKNFINHWSDGIDRGVTKRPTMCEAYGLTFYGIQKYLRLEGHLDWVDKDKRGGAIVELARAIQASLNQVLSSSNAGKSWLKEISDIATKNNKHLMWTTPSGFRVVHYYTENQTRRSIAKLFNNRELTFFVKTDRPNGRAARQAIAPNYIHSLDAAHMFLVLERMLREQITEDFCMIHDSYGCHANFIDQLHKITREEFASMHRYNQLEFFKTDVQNTLGVNLPDIPTRGDFNVDRVLESEYFFS
tara:strand:- start:805 stop:3252 length:2448 start_codon:yes stop_codon:yes gene_type:complete